MAAWHHGSMEGCQKKNAAIHSNAIMSVQKCDTPEQNFLWEAPEKSKREVLTQPEGCQRPKTPMYPNVIGSVQKLDVSQQHVWHGPSEESNSGVSVELGAVVQDLTARGADIEALDSNLTSALKEIHFTLNNLAFVGTPQHKSLRMKARALDLATVDKPEKSHGGVSGEQEGDQRANTALDYLIQSTQMLDVPEPKVDCGAPEVSPRTSPYLINFAQPPEEIGNGTVVHPDGIRRSNTSLDTNLKGSVQDCNMIDQNMSHGAFEESCGRALALGGSTSRPNSANAATASSSGTSAGFTQQSVGLGVNESAQHEADPSEVFMHIYEIGQLPSGVNRWLESMGLAGAWHVGIEVFGREYSYGVEEDLETGISIQIRPKGHPIHRYRRSMSLGFTPLAQYSVKKLMKELDREWLSSEYHPLRRNCISFAEELCKRLGVRKVPDHICSLPRTLSSLLGY